MHPRAPGTSGARFVAPGISPLRPIDIRPTVRARRRPMIERTRHGSTTRLRMAWPKGNALDLEVVRGLTAALCDAQRDGTRAIVLTGTGTIFGAGVNLIDITHRGPAYVREFLAA